MPTIKNKKLPRGFLQLPINPDKKMHEKWHDKNGNVARSISNPPRPYRAIFCADPSRGKTFQAQQLILKAQPMFDYLFVVHPYSEGTTEWNELEPTEILPEIPDPSFWEDYADGRICLILEDYEIRNKEDQKALSSLFR